MLGGNEVASEEDDTTLSLTLTKVNKSENQVEERSKNKRKLYRVAISKTIDQCGGIRL